MAVPAVITDLLVAVADNVPKGSDSVTTSTGPDEYFRAHAAIVRREQAQFTAVASAATVDLGAIDTGNYGHITGTATITSFGTVAAGIERTVVFDGVLTLTHNATSLILRTGENRTTAAGDVAVFVSEGAGNWREKAYHTAYYACRAWVNFDGTGTIAIRASGNVSSITDNGVGDYTVNFTNAMPDANYAMNGTQGSSSIDAVNSRDVYEIGTRTTSGIRIRTYYTDPANSYAIDPEYINVSIFR